MLGCNVLGATALCVVAAAAATLPNQHGHILECIRHAHQSRARATQPNVVVIMADDQDLLLDSMSVMPNVKSLIGDNGVTYSKHYCSTAMCCPSRVSFFTGKNAHNTNVTDVQPPYGGWPKFTDQGWNDDYLPVWLADTDIKAYYVGKFLNSYSEDTMATPEPPKGWTNSSFLVDPLTYNYLHSRWTNHADAFTVADTTIYDDIHTTNVTKQKAVEMIDQAVDAGGQFFLMVAPVAPHFTGHGDAPPVPAEWQDKFADQQAPRGENFNPDIPSGASWVKALPKLTEAQINHGDEMHRNRLGNLAALDVMVSEIVAKLDDEGLLDNTYIIYTSDNGYHIGNHRLPPGKRCPYEEDINIPFLIRGPDVAQGVISDGINNHVDAAPTILQMLGLPVDNAHALDGSPIPYTVDDLSTSSRTELQQVEFWQSSRNPTGVEGAYGNNTYKAIRVITSEGSFYYAKWCTAESEFYDMIADPGQLDNHLAGQVTDQTFFERPETQLYDRLDALLMVAKSCKEDTCRDPWSVLFPAGEVKSLPDAMQENYDQFFGDLPKVEFDSCQNGYIVTEEGPQSVTPFS